LACIERFRQRILTRLAPRPGAACRQKVLQRRLVECLPKHVVHKTVRYRRRSSLSLSPNDFHRWNSFCSSCKRLDTSCEAPTGLRVPPPFRPKGGWCEDVLASHFFRCRRKPLEVSALSLSRRPFDLNLVMLTDPVIIRRIMTALQDTRLLQHIKILQVMTTTSEPHFVITLSHSPLSNSSTISILLFTNVISYTHRWPVHRKTVARSAFMTSQNKLALL